MTRLVTPFRWNGNLLTVADLDSWAADISRDAPVESPRFSNSIQISIICHFLGRKWYEEHAFVTSPKRSFLYPHFGTDGLASIWSMRILNLAEMLFNLQAMDGFRERLTQMTLDQLESTLAEFQIGMMLHQDQIAFRYLDPATVTGESPDIEIRLTGGATALAEIKCKIEETEISEKTILYTLNKGRKKLPEGKPGLVFIKVPQEWSLEGRETIMLPELVLNTTMAFLRNTSRVVKVVYYMFHLAPRAEGVRNSHTILEISNPRNPSDSPWSDHLFPLTRTGYNWITIPALLERWANLKKSVSP